MQADASPTPRRRSNSADNWLDDTGVAAAAVSRRKSIRYRGANIPSKTFQRLCGAAPGQAPVPPLRTPRSRARLAAAMAELGIAAEADSGGAAFGAGTTFPVKVERNRHHQSDDGLDCDAEELLNNDFFLKLRQKLDSEAQFSETIEPSDLQSESVTKETLASSATRIQELRAAIQQSRLETKCC